MSKITNLTGPIFYNKQTVDMGEDVAATANM
jgi:hypothetical protein